MVDYIQDRQSIFLDLLSKSPTGMAAAMAVDIFLKSELKTNYNYIYIYIILIKHHKNQIAMADLSSCLGPSLAAV